LGQRVAESGISVRQNEHVFVDASGVVRNRLYALTTRNKTNATIAKLTRAVRNAP
jgi:hypothetical protein